MSVLILGIGNTMMSDDGFGPKMVEALGRHYWLPAGVQAVDGGTLGLDLLPRLEGMTRLLIIDALEMDAEPGKVFRFAGEEVPEAFAARLSVHQMGVQDLLAVAELQGILPGEIVVWGVQPASIDIGLELSRAVAAAAEEVLTGILEELRRWGVAWRRAD